MSQNTSEKPPKESSRLVAFISILVIVHFLYTLALPIAFIYEIKFLPFLESAYPVWLCQPVFIATCLWVLKSTSQLCKMLVWIDVGLSVLQPASIVFLYAIVEKIG
jgi:hypothetical protein